MLNALKFVRGAVAKKDFQPALTHFRIADGRVMGYNGTIALSSPVDIDITATPKALPFVKAIERCTGDTTAIHLTGAGKIGLKSGKFKAFVDCAPDSDILDSIVPEGELVALPGELLKAVKVLLPYVGTDASRPWATGILLRGASAYATNNIIVVEYWIGSNMPEVNLPASAIAELNRIGQEPTSVMLGTNSITFFFEGDRWLRSQLLSLDWPNVEHLLDVASAECDMQPVPEGLYEAVETVGPFAELEGRVFFREGVVSTTPEGEAGASFAIEGLPDYGAYDHKFMLSLQQCVAKIDFTKHPQPCPFVGENLRGVFLGMIDQ